MSRNTNRAQNFPRAGSRPFHNMAWVIPQSQKNRTFTIFILQTKIAFYCGDVSLGSKLLTLLHKMTDMLDDKRMTAHQNKSDVRSFCYIAQFTHLIFVNCANTKRENNLQLRLQERLRCFILVVENKTTAVREGCRPHEPAQVIRPPTQRLMSHRTLSISFYSCFGKTGN